jgi:hypothetical protein
MTRPIDRSLLDNLARPLPAMPGRYFWDAHGTHVEVYRKPGVDGLYVTPPGAHAVEVRVTARIAGTFVRVSKRTPENAGA